ncbi:MAG TPA: alpha/beta hydrolase [Chloroflexota bacterium]|nr:alpha/beta hydrolase [Chloroflexota bacterium]
MFVQLPDGLRMYCEERGEGPPVVLVHGLRCSHVTWRHQVPALSRAGYRVVAPDLRGHGETDKPVGPYSHELWTGDLLALLDILELEQPVLAGHSLGGGIVQSFALQHPERVHALVLVSTSPQRAPYVSEALRRSAEIALKEGRLPSAEASVRGRVGPGYAEAHPDEIAIESASMVTDPQAFGASCLGNAADRNIVSELHRFTFPVLFIAGESDRADTKTNAARYREHLADVETHILPGVGHMVPMEAPDIVNAVLLAFLQRVHSESC